MTYYPRIPNGTLVMVTPALLKVVKLKNWPDVMNDAVYKFGQVIRMIHNSFDNFYTIRFYLPKFIPKTPYYTRYNYPQHCIVRVDKTDRVGFINKEDVIVSNDPIGGWICASFRKYDNTNHDFIVKVSGIRKLQRFKYCLKNDKNKHLLE